MGDEQSIEQQIDALSRAAVTPMPAEQSTVDSKLTPTCPGCGERHEWDPAFVWGLLSIRCPKSPTGYVFVEVAS